MSSPACFLITLALLGSAGLSLTLPRNPGYLAVPLKAIGSELAGWTQTGAESVGPIVPKRLLPADYLARSYCKDNRCLSLSIAFYADQHGGEGMHSPRSCLPGIGWEIWKYDSIAVPDRGVAVKINKFFIQRNEQRMLAYYWYQSHERILASEYLGKLMLIKDTFMGGRTSGALVRIVMDDVPETDKDAVEFASAVMPQVGRCFGPLTGR